MRAATRIASCESELVWGVFEHLHVQRHHREVVRDAVVQLAGDPTSLGEDRLSFLLGTRLELTFETTATGEREPQGEPDSSGHRGEDEIETDVDVDTGFRGERNERRATRNPPVYERISEVQPSLMTRAAETAAAVRTCSSDPGMKDSANTTPRAHVAMRGFQR